MPLLSLSQPFTARTLPSDIDLASRKMAKNETTQWYTVVLIQIPPFSSSSLTVY